MNTGEINRLLEKYYNGLSSVEEEEELRRFFREGKVTAELEDEQQIFSYLDSTGSYIPMPDESFENRIITAIDRIESEKRGMFRKRVLYSVLSSAAAVLLIFGTWFFIIRQSEPADTFKDPRLAYNEAVRVLYSVSEKMNTGLNAMEPARKATKTASYGLNRVERSAGMISDNLKPLNYFRKAMVIVSSPLVKSKKLK